MAAQSRGVNCDLAREIGATIANELRTDASERHKHKGSAGGTRRASIDTASTRADELMRSHRVTRRRKTRKAKSDAMDVQKQDRQVAIFLDACKAFEAATTEVTKAISKFSPEAKKLTARRLERIVKAVTVLKGRLA